ncbi:MAG: hypothetical protein LCH96_15160 [Actinobacteria bacterium]|nr:hypothetical protein [Actinomycetota bacterium]
MDAARAQWEQPVFEAGLEVVAVDLITRVVQDVFVGLDPVALVHSLDDVDLTPDERLRVASLIDRAVVELDVSFRAEDGGPVLAEG